MNGLSASAINWLKFVIEVVCETEARIFILCVSVTIFAQGRASFCASAVAAFKRV